MCLFLWHDLISLSQEKSSSHLYSNNSPFSLCLWLSPLSPSSSCPPSAPSCLSTPRLSLTSSLWPSHSNVRLSRLSLHPFWFELPKATIKKKWLQFYDCTSREMLAEKGGWGGRWVKYPGGRWVGRMEGIFSQSWKREQQKEKTAV